MPARQSQQPTRRNAGWQTGDEMADLAGRHPLLDRDPFQSEDLSHAGPAPAWPAQRITWSWTRHVRLRSFSTDSDQRIGHSSLRCDVCVRLVVRSFASSAVIFYGLIILWDSRLSRAADVRRELQSLLRISDSYERQGQLNTFPTLVVMTPDARRAALWQAQMLRLATER